MLNRRGIKLDEGSFDQTAADIPGQDHPEKALKGSPRLSIRASGRPIAHSIYQRGGWDEIDHTVKVVAEFAGCQSHAGQFAVHSVQKGHAAYLWPSVRYRIGR